MKNQFFVCGNEVFIKLKRRKSKLCDWTIIDLEDLDKVQLHNGTWYRSSDSDRSLTYYVISDRKRRRIRMHRVLLELGDDYVLEPDHKDGNGLNNKRSNLQVVTKQENIFKRPIFCNNTSGVKGVNFNKHSGKWEATITINHKRVYLGKFWSKEKAIEIRLGAEDAYID